MEKLLPAKDGADVREINRAGFSFRDAEVARHPPKTEEEQRRQNASLVERVAAGREGSRVAL